MTVKSYIVFFLVEGMVNYVLPRYENYAYYTIKVGQCFGHADLADEQTFLEPETNPKELAHFKKKKIYRLFTVQATEYCDLLTMTMEDCIQMKLEFPDQFMELFHELKAQRDKELLLKLDALKKMEYI